MKKKLLIITPIVIVIAAVAAYFFVTPSVQINSYKETSESYRSALSSSASAVIAASNQNAFVKPDVTALEAKNAVKISENALADLEAKIKSSETPLTTFNELPLLSNTSANYKKTVELADLEKEYIATANSYVEEFKAVTQYNKDSLPVVEINEEMQEVGEKLQKVTSPEEYVAVLDQLVAKLEAAKKVVQPLTPPESVKELHELNINGVDEVVIIIKQFKAAIAAMDVEKIITLQTKLSTKLTALSEDSKKIAAKLLDESKLAKLGDALTDLNKQIETKRSEL